MYNLNSKCEASPIFVVLYGVMTFILGGCQYTDSVCLGFLWYIDVFVDRACNKIRVVYLPP